MGYDYANARSGKIDFISNVVDQPSIFITEMYKGKAIYELFQKTAGRKFSPKITVMRLQFWKAIK